MDKVIDIFRSVQRTSGLNEKQRILSNNKDNELLKKCLIFLLDGNITTGISTKKLDKMTISKAREYDTQELQSFVDVMNYLKIHNTGTDNDVACIRKFICSNSKSDAECEFYEQMVTKKFRLGADSKLVNKAIPGLIEEFNVQLGTPIEKVKLKGDELIFISQKVNGNRIAFVGNECRTRQNKRYIGVDHIIKDLLALGYENYFVDGELLYKNTENLPDSVAFQIGTGIANSKSSDKSKLKFVVFDIFPLNEFWSGKSKAPYSVRYKALDELEEKLKTYHTENIEVVRRFYHGYDHNEIWKWLDYAEEHDMEGCMINLDEPYECKRTKYLLKVKKFFDCDVRCIGVEEGTGRNKGKLGALICDYRGYKLKVGTGFSDEDRIKYWNNPGLVVGKIITVKYKEETQNKNGGISIQFPVFVCIRYDKDEESYN